jgi:aspartate carbamoyltransferase catalytic subunit
VTDNKPPRDDLRPPDEPPTRHFISNQDVTREDVERLLATARTRLSSSRRLSSREGSMRWA